MKEPLPSSSDFAFKMNSVGKIVYGYKAGYFLKVIDDSENTGGYLILTAETESFEHGHDGWVENMTDLQGYFEEAGWIVEWRD